MKIRIKKKCINYCKEKKWKENRRENELRKILNVELENIDQIKGWSIEKYLITKQELEEIEKKKCIGAAIRSKIKYMYEGERCTSFFLGVEKKRQRKMWISTLKNKNGQTVKEIDKILSEVQNFFQKLYTKQKCENVEINKALGALKRKLNAEDREWCETEIGEEEIRTAIKSLNRGKSPGEDGLTAEFFQAFQDSLIPIFGKII